MRRRHASSIAPVIRATAQVVVCGIGLAAGLIVGAVVIFFTGLWSEFGESVRTSIDSMTKNDLLVIAATTVIVFGCAWLGLRWGISRAVRLGV
jgi:hypothetical protein